MCPCNSKIDESTDDNIKKNIIDIDTRINSCDCGFDEEISMFPSNAVFGQSYVKNQQLDKTFIPSVGLKMGTLFPELVNSYKPCQSMEEIAFIKAMNMVKEGCNK